MGIVYQEGPSLARDLGLPLRTLYAVSNRIPAHYHRAEVPKRDGGVRVLRVPDPVLKDIQRRIARVLLSWYGEGIRSCADLERHLALLALRERCETEVAEILDAPVSSFTTGERTLIARWYEEYGYGREMIEAACQRAGEKRSARYLNGMLKKWYAKGYRTPRDLEAEGPANIQEAGREITPERDLLLRNPDYTPTFRKRGGI